VTFDELLERRLVFTVGKGGVGRTTVTLALALEAARRGRRVLAVELEGAHALGHALAAQRESRHRSPGIERIDHLVVDGRRALEEYLALVIPVRRLLKTIFSSNVYQYFVAAAPGLKELMAIGKIWYEVERGDREPARGRRGRGSTAPDIVVVDGPATGHSLQYLRMPRAAADAFPVGLVHREAERISGLLKDDRSTAVAIVTIAEEMPVNETVEIYAGLGQLELPRTVLVVNQVHRAPATDEELVALRAGVAASARDGAPSGDGEPAANGDRLFAEVVARAEEECGWAGIHRRNIERLAEAVPLPTVLLPFIFAEEFCPEHVAELSRTLAAQLDGGPARAERAAGTRPAARKRASAAERR